MMLESDAEYSATEFSTRLEIKKSKDGHEEVLKIVPALKAAPGWGSEVAALFDHQNLVSSAAMLLMVGHDDSLSHNWFLWQSPQEKWYMTPYDLDGALGWYGDMTAPGSAAMQEREHPGLDMLWKSQLWSHFLSEPANIDQVVHFAEWLLAEALSPRSMALASTLHDAFRPYVLAEPDLAQLPTPRPWTSDADHIAQWESVLPHILKQPEMMMQDLRDSLAVPRMITEWTRKYVKGGEKGLDLSFEAPVDMACPGDAPPCALTDSALLRFDVTISRDEEHTDVILASTDISLVELPLRITDRFAKGEKIHVRVVSRDMEGHESTTLKSFSARRDVCLDGCPVSSSCPFDCSGRGSCELTEEGESFCDCFDPYVGEGCSSMRYPYAEPWAPQNIKFEDVHSSGTYALSWRGDDFLGYQIEYGGHAAHLTEAKELIFPARSRDDLFYYARQAISDLPVGVGVEVGAWCNATDVSGSSASSFSLYADYQVTDAAGQTVSIWGRNAPCSPGSHGWERLSILLEPLEASSYISSATIWMLFRDHTGVGAFSDLSFEIAE